MKIEVETLIQAPPAVCFDLARDMDLHVESAHKTREKIVAGRKNGLLELGETVVFEAVHFGIRQRFSAKITESAPPHRFTDEMTRGAFRSFVHQHEFEARGDYCLMRDTLIYQTPFGIFGAVFNFLFLRRHLRAFIEERAKIIKQHAEKG